MKARKVGDGEMRTSELLAQEGYLRPLAEMREANPWVSRTSHFNDDDWLIDLEAPSQVPTWHLNWKAVPGLLGAEFKLFALSLGVKRGGSDLSLKTMADAAMGMLVLGSWMRSERMRSLSDIGAGGGDAFLHALADKLREIELLEPGEEPNDWDPRISEASRPIGRGGKLANGTVRKVAAVLIRARELEERFVALGIRPMLDDPFDAAVLLKRERTGKERKGALGPRRAGPKVSVERIASAFGQLQRQVKERIPDAVLFPLQDAAERLLGAPAEDVIRFTGMVMEKVAAGLTEREALAQMEGFTFSRIEGEQAPWRAPFSNQGIANMRAFRGMLARIRDAASIVVLRGSGMRPGEYIMLAGGRLPRTSFKTRRHASGDLLETAAGRRSGQSPSPGDAPRSSTLPSCVTESLSVSGMTVMSHIHGKVYKQRKRPANAYWLIGGRQDDCADPMTVKALDVLERLFAPMQPFADDHARGKLMLRIESRPDEPFRCSTMTVGRLQGSIPLTIASVLDLSGLPDTEGIYDLTRYADSNGACINLYQFRRTYAQLAYRTSPGLLFPLARQMQHETSEVTKRSYVTNDPTLLRELDAAHSRETVAMFREMVRGERRLGGTMGSRIDELVSLSRERLAALPMADLDRAIRNEFRVDDFRTYFFEDTICFNGLRPRASLCNRLAGRNDWKVAEPDLAVRSGALCVQCPNGGFDRDRHGPRILRRYVSNMTVYLRERRTGRKLLFHAWRRNAERDAAILTQLGIAVPSDEEINRGI